MAITYEDAKDLRTRLEQRDQRRHQELRALRRYWQGDYWDDTEQAATGVAQLFRDLVERRGDTGPDLKLVHNVLQEVCVKYQTFLSPVPMIRTFVDPPHSDLRRKQQTLKERVLYGTWAANDMPRRAGEYGWYLPLMGDCFLGIWPDFVNNVCRMVVRSPELAHPVHSWDGKLDIVVFRWEADERDVARQFPNFKVGEPAARRRRLGLFKRQSSERKIELLEYSDGNEYHLWAGEQKLKSIPHGYGFNLYGQMFFIPVPGEPFNHGAVEQIVNLVEMGNALHSLNFQSAFESVFSPLVLIDPSKAPETLNLGAGGVIPLNAGGDAKRLAPEGLALGMIQGFIRDNQDKILEASGMPRVNFGESPASSIVTGKAVNALQGAATGSSVEMVQGLGIGPELVNWNEKALFIYRNEMKDDQINLYGLIPGDGHQNVQFLSPRQFSLSLKGKEIIGSPRNEVVFGPHLNEHEKLVMGLQALGGDLVSKAHVAESIGISDWSAMQEEIAAEKVSGAMVQMMVEAFIATGQSAADPVQEARDTTERAVSFLGGAREGPHPLLAPNGMGPGPGGPIPSPGGPPGPMAPGGPALAPPGGGASAMPPGPPPAAAPGAAGGAATLDQVAAAFQNVTGLIGRVFLVGEIVQRGETSEEIDVAVTEPDDQQTISTGLPELAGRIEFHLVEEQPDEPHIEVAGIGVQAAREAPAPAVAEPPVEVPA